MNEWTVQVVNILAPSVATLLGVLLMAVANSLRKKLTADWQRSVFDAVEAQTRTAVLATKQLLADEWKAKAEGGFSASEAKDLQDKALSEVKKQLGAGTLKALEQIVGSGELEHVLRAKIEAAVSQNKSAGPQVIP
jgi:hypothetical protein